MYNFNIIKLDAISSTSDLLKEKYHQGKVKNNDLILAAYQNKGRGQHNNRWVAASGENITFSIFSTFQDFSLPEKFLLNAAVCSAIVKALSGIGLFDTKIKWPNDILSENRKIGGILIENIVRKNTIVASIIGVGINVNQIQFENLPNASSLRQILNKKLDLYHVLKVLLYHLREMLDNLLQGNKRNYLDQYNTLLWKRDETRLFEVKQNQVKAVLREVDENGKAKLEFEKGKMISFNTTELKIPYTI